MFDDMIMHLSTVVVEPTLGEEVVLGFLMDSPSRIVKV